MLNKKTIQIRSLIHNLIDESIVYSVLYRVWGLSSGLITLLLLTLFFTPTIQGYYYIFLSFIALQVVLELGLYTVIINVASHEWSKLSLDRFGQITGSETSLSRLIDLGRGVTRWYGIVVFIFVPSAGLIGISILPPDDVGVWYWPWLMLVFFAGLHLMALPILSLLEGCGQVLHINKYRLYIGITSSLGLWASMVLGYDLWSMVVSAVMVLILDVYIIFFRYRSFFKPFWRSKPRSKVNWMTEVWPMQWRLGLQSLSGYFVLQFMTPVIFNAYGAIEAGRVGMTMQIIFAIQTVGHAWLQTKLPMFGDFVAKRNFTQLNLVWSKYAGLSVGVVAILGTGLIFAVYFASKMEWALMDRVMQVEYFIILVFAQILAQVIQCQASYIRAFKKEYFVLPGFIGGLLAGIFIWFGVSIFGIRGGIYGYACAILIMMLWTTLIFTSNRHAIYQNVSVAED